MRISQEMFSTDYLWDSEYGGSQWAKICDAWQKLNQTKTTNEMMIWIDHVYDIQHNSGSMLDKFDDYYKNESLDWLIDALEIKKNLKNPYEIWNDISYSMKELAGFYFKGAKGETTEKNITSKGASILVQDFKTHQNIRFVRMKNSNSNEIELGKYYQANVGDSYTHKKHIVKIIKTMYKKSVCKVLPIAIFSYSNYSEQSSRIATKLYKKSPITIDFSRIDTSYILIPL